MKYGLKVGELHIIDENFIRGIKRMKYFTKRFLNSGSSYGYCFCVSVALSGSGITIHDVYVLAENEQHIFTPSELHDIKERVGGGYCTRSVIAITKLGPMSKGEL